MRTALHCDPPTVQRGVVQVGGFGGEDAKHDFVELRARQRL
jgi:hypothetical protein